VALAFHDFVLLIPPQEFGQSGFWLPGGQLDAGESLRTAVQRECQEEAGVKVVLVLAVLLYLLLELMLLYIFTLLTCFDLKKAILYIPSSLLSSINSCAGPALGRA